MTLVLVTHGTRDPAGTRTAETIADAVAALLPDVPVRLAFADVHGPSVTSTLLDTSGPVVVVPAFLAAGYHVRVDIPTQIALAGRPDVRLAAPLGPTTAVVAAARDRLVEAGLRPSDTVTLAAAGSSDPRAGTDVRRAARLLGASLRRPVTVRYIGRPGWATPASADQRVAVASWLLAPGLFHRWLCRSAGSAVVSEPLGAHPLVVTELVRRYQDADVLVSGLTRPSLIP